MGSTPGSSIRRRRSFLSAEKQTPQNRENVMSRTLSITTRREDIRQQLNMSDSPPLPVIQEEAETQQQSNINELQLTCHESVPITEAPAIRISTLDQNLSDYNAEHVEVEPDCFLWFIARFFVVNLLNI
jgi:nitrate reductase cytochrome c-type subunit